jgi:electron transfer flavoprotein beta subunit
MWTARAKGRPVAASWSPARTWSGTGHSLEAALKILVTVKRVPDTAAEKRLDPGDKTLDRESVETILNPVDEYAVEEALRLKEQHGGEVVVLCMGPSAALATVRKALSMGPDAAVHVHDDALHGSCALNTAKVLDAAVRRVEPDIVLCGSESTDARTSLVPSALAEYLGWPGLTGAKQLEVDGSTVRVHRETENGYDVLEAEGPAVVSVVKGINEPRYPSFKGIMAAKSKPVTDYSLADLGIDPGEVGTAGATTEVVDFAPRPPRQAGQQVKDPGDGSAAVELAEFLASHKFI